MKRLVKNKKAENPRKDTKCDLNTANKIKTLETLSIE